SSSSWCDWRRVKVSPSVALDARGMLMSRFSQVSTSARRLRALAAVAVLLLLLTSCTAGTTSGGGGAAAGSEAPSAAAGGDDEGGGDANTISLWYLEDNQLLIEQAIERF